MILVRLLTCGALIASLMPVEPNIGFGHPQFGSPILESAHQEIMGRIETVRADLARHSRAAREIEAVLSGNDGQDRG